MLVNADFSRAVIVAPHQYEWVASPQPGVERVMLDRIGAEQARATSIVRYAPDSSFPPHAHPGGEEILVMSGTFSDELGDFPEGWYLRNPPGSSHRPSSRPGTLIFVKLRQMEESETQPVRIDTRDAARWHEQQGGRAVCPLYSGEREQACLQRVAPHTPIFPGPVDGAELLVLEGELLVDGQRCTRGAWIRLPAGHYPSLAAGQQGATFYLKTGPLPEGAATQ
jgi:anti-sigma factor ChrR (cupin superfamily)